MCSTHGTRNEIMISTTNIASATPVMPSTFAFSIGCSPDSADASTCKGFVSIHTSVDRCLFISFVSTLRFAV